MKHHSVFLPLYSERLLGLPLRVALGLSSNMGIDDKARERGFGRQGWGPHSAIITTPFHAAFLMLAAAWQGIPQPRAAKAGWLLWGIPGKCPNTGQECFGDALHRVLSDPTLAETVTSVEVAILSEEARIHWSEGMMTRFVRDETRAQLAETDMRHIVHWPGKLLYGVACDLRREHPDAPDPAPAEAMQSVGMPH